MSETDTATATEATTLLSGTESQASEASATATEQASTDAFPSILNADGSFVDGWPNLLQGDEYAEVRATAANYKNLPALLKGLKDSKAAAMAKTEGMIRLPGAEATPEEIAAYRQAIGVPETADGYELPKELPPDVIIDDEVFADFKATAHGLNLTPNQVQALAQWQVKTEQLMAAKDAAETKAFVDGERAKLETEWGANFTKNAMEARRAAATFGLDTNDPIFQRADVVKAFQQVAASLSEDKLVTGESLSNKLSPEAQADDILNNPANAFHKAFSDASDPRHGEAVAKFNELMRKAFPG